MPCRGTAASCGAALPPQNSRRQRYRRIHLCQPLIPTCTTKWLWGGCSDMTNASMGSRAAGADGMVATARAALAAADVTAHRRQPPLGRGGLTQTPSPPEPPTSDDWACFSAMTWHGHENGTSRACPRQQRPTARVKLCACSLTRLQSLAQIPLPKPCRCWCPASRGLQP